MSDRLPGGGEKCGRSDGVGVIWFISSVVSSPGGDPALKVKK